MPSSKTLVGRRNLTAARRFVFRDLNGSEHRAVHALEGNQVPAGIGYRDVHLPFSLIRLSHGRLNHCLRRASDIGSPYGRSKGISSGTTSRGLDVARPDLLARPILSFDIFIFLLMAYNLRRADRTTRPVGANDCSGLLPFPGAFGSESLRPGGHRSYGRRRRRGRRWHEFSCCILPR